MSRRSIDPCYSVGTARGANAPNPASGGGRLKRQSMWNKTGLLAKRSIQFFTAQNCKLSIESKLKIRAAWAIPGETRP
jgi:hypothetical protein